MKTRDKAHIERIAAKAVSELSPVCLGVEEAKRGRFASRSKMQLPDHYFRIRPFRVLFESGLPILLYHKMGKARLLHRRKGLFVSRHLFSSQLSELAQAGFGFGKLGEAYSGRKIAISFDDGYASCFEQGMDILETF